jgi:hypothetical protein
MNMQSREFSIFQASKRLENTQGFVYQTAQTAQKKKGNLRTTYIVKTRRRVSKLPQPFRVVPDPHRLLQNHEMISLASKEAGRQASEASQNPQAPQSLPSGVVWAWPSLHFLASTRVLIAHHARGKRSSVTSSLSSTIG